MGIETALIAGAVGSIGAAAIDNQSAKRSVRSAERQRAESQRFIEKNIKQARGDLFQLFPQAQESRRAGAQAGLDLMAQTIPQQINSFQGGNVAAQNALIQGLPQQQNALLGRRVTLDQQPVRLGGGLTVPQLPAANSMAPQGNPMVPQNTGLAAYPDIIGGE